jgi:peptidoglycan/LPS O-acetylase OafA/YrhL
MSPADMNQNDEQPTLSVDRRFRAFLSLSSVTAVLLGLVFWLLITHKAAERYFTLGLMIWVGVEGVLVVHFYRREFLARRRVVVLDRKRFWLAMILLIATCALGIWMVLTDNYSIYLDAAVLACFGALVLIMRGKRRAENAS